MKKLLFILFVFLNYWNIEAQYFTTLNSDLNISPTSNNSIIDVNMKTFTHTDSEFINEEHTVTGNIITMNVCYYVTGFQFANNYQHTFPVTVPSDNDYTIIINLYRSQTQVTCDYTELTDTKTLDFTTPLTETIYLGVEDFELLENQISIYPNPVKDIVNIDNPNNLIFNSIVVHNILGEKIEIYTTSFESLDLRYLNSGMYFLELNTEKGNITKKIIVSN